MCVILFLLQLLVNFIRKKKTLLNVISVTIESKLI